MVAELQAAVAEASSLTPTQTFDTIDDYTTITATDAVNVIEVTNKIQLSGQTLTFDGSADELFVVNIAGDLNFSGTSQILLVGE